MLVRRASSTPWPGVYREGWEIQGQEEGAGPGLAQSVHMGVELKTDEEESGRTTNSPDLVFIKSVTVVTAVRSTVPKSQYDPINANFSQGKRGDWQ